MGSIDEKLINSSICTITTWESIVLIIDIEQAEKIIADAVDKEREECAKIAEKKERDRFEAVGNPMIKAFVPWIAKAIRERSK